MKIKSSLSRRISANIIILSSICIIAILYIILSRTTILMLTEAGKSIKYAIKAGSAEINGQIIEIETATRNLAWQANQYADDRYRLERFLTTFVRENNNIFGGALAPVPECSDIDVDKNAICAYTDTITNKIVTSSLHDEQYDYTMTNWYLIPKLLKKPVWTEPYFDEGNTNGRITTYAFPVLNEDNEVVCVVAAHISLNWIAEITKGLDVFPNSEVNILSKGGIFVSKGREDIADETLFCKALESGDKELFRKAYEMMNYSPDSTYVDMGYFDEETVGMLLFKHLENGWGLFINTPFEDIFADVKDISIFLSVTALIGLLLLFFFLIYVIRRNLRPIKEFSIAAGSIAKGNFDTKLPEIKHKDETYALRNSLDDMQKDLKKYVKELTETSAAKKIYENEISIAKKIQASMVPTQFPENTDFDIYGFVEAAREIGGDLFGYSIYNGRLYFYIGDVSGKGIPAALYMSFVISAMELEFTTCSSLGESITKINNYLSANNPMGLFITLFCGCMDFRTGTMEYCNCGHNPIVVVPPSGKPEFLKAQPNIVLSTFEDFPYVTEKMNVTRGTRFILYTDGITEAERKDLTQYGEDRLLLWAESIEKDADCMSVADSLKKDVLKFTEGNVQNDDMTILAVKVK